MKIATVIIFILLLISVFLIQSSNKPNQSNASPTFNSSATLPTIQQSDEDIPRINKGDSKPFWTGNEIIQVCKVPYYTSEGCNDLDVALVNDTTAQIQLSSETYRITNNLTCYGGNGSGDEPKYVFCRSWDSNNQQWDFFPTWVRI